MNYIGIDQSYTSTGLVVLDNNCSLIDSVLITSNPQDDIFRRSWEVSESIMMELQKYTDTQIAIEGLAFSMTGNATRDLAGLQFTIINKIKFVLHREVTIIAPPTLKKNATGNGRAKKPEMFAALPNDVSDFFIKYKKYKKTKGLYDIVDAYFLAKSLINKS